MQSFDQESELIHILVSPLPGYLAFGKITYLYFSSLICKVGAITVPTNRAVVRVNTLNGNRNH